MSLLRRLAARIRGYLIGPVLAGLQNPGPMAPAVTQKALWLLFQQQHRAGGPRPPFTQVGFRAHSQNEEDGILLFIFSLIGVSHMTCVEICAGNGIECNTANLIIHHRWTGLLCDGDARNVETARQYYAAHPDTKYWPPAIAQEWVTRGNVNDLVQRHGFSGEIDLLSIDVDGVDYWLWEALTCVSPRVVVLEFNHLWGPEASVTVPYRDDFVADFTRYGSDYAGASLSAFVKLGNTKGYRLVGTNAIATNAFFVRNDIACDWLPRADASACFGHPRAKFGMSQRLPGVKDREWVQV